MPEEVPTPVETIDVEMIAVQKREVRVVVRLPKKETRVVLEKDGKTVVPMPFLTICGLMAAEKKDEGDWVVVENGTRMAMVAEADGKPDLNMKKQKRCETCKGYGVCRKFCEPCQGTGLV